MDVVADYALLPHLVKYHVIVYHFFLLI